MTKSELQDAVTQYKNETKTAIETILNALNAGQRKKVVKDEAVKQLCERYGVDV